MLAHWLCGVSTNMQWHGADMGSGAYKSKPRWTFNLPVWLSCGRIHLEMNQAVGEACQSQSITSLKWTNEKTFSIKVLKLSSDVFFFLMIFSWAARSRQRNVPRSKTWTVSVQGQHWGGTCVCVCLHHLWYPKPPNHQFFGRVWCKHCDKILPLDFNKSLVTEFLVSSLCVFPSILSCRAATLSASCWRLQRRPSQRMIGTGRRWCWRPPRDCVCCLKRRPALF